MNAVERRLIREFVALAEKEGFEEFIECCRLSAKESAELRIAEIKRKLKSKEVDMSEMTWDYAAHATATTHYLGEVFEHEIEDNIFLVGIARTEKGSTKFYKRFISHPFHQHGRTMMPAE